LGGVGVVGIIKSSPSWERQKPIGISPVLGGVAPWQFVGFTNNFCRRHLVEAHLSWQEKKQSGN